MTTTHLDTQDPRYREAAGEILHRHNSGEAEANITTAVRSFLTLTRLVDNREIVEENPPADGSRRAVDLTALDTFIEFKRRIGTTGGLTPNPDYIEQLDGYLRESQDAGKGVRKGILTDGKHWLLRWPGAGEVKTYSPYAFTLENADGWLPLYEWLRDQALETKEQIPLDRQAIAEHFGPDSASYEFETANLRLLAKMEDARLLQANPTVAVKRRLWENLLTAALGELAQTPEQLDGLFIRHTYLSIVVGMVVQASFNIDLRKLAEENPADLVQGQSFRNHTGLQGIVESDFFSWPVEVGGLDLLKTIARRISRFDWRHAPSDIAAILYETVIPPAERKQLGEYYTPDWLARAIVEELVTEPLNQRVLDPACGSGTFIAEAVTHFTTAAQTANLDPGETLTRLRESVTGIDVHPVAVHLARSAWTLAARPAIEAAANAGYDSSVSVPVYLGDALQLRFRSGDMFAAHEVTIPVEDEQNAELVFPISLVERADEFDRLMSDIAGYIENGQDAKIALDDHRIESPEREPLEETIATMRQLHDEGRNHIWAYYTRNLVRPVALSRSKVDVIVGNPPWLNYNKAISTLRKELKRQSKDGYGIWAGGHYATQQDVASLFYARCTDLYLRRGGIIGMVMPHSALQAGQYTKWRTGEWKSTLGGRGDVKITAVDFTYKTAWDLERLEPNTFFPVPASVVFAEHTGTKPQPLAGEVERWLGKTDGASVRRERITITDTSVEGGSPYAGFSRAGATVDPRRLFFVEETANTAFIRAGSTVTVNPRYGAQDKKPWRNLDLAALSGQTIENAHLFNVHLGETVVPYATLEPLKALLPLKRGNYQFPKDDNGVGGIALSGLERRMRERWKVVSDLWETHNPSATKSNLLSKLDYYGKLSEQLRWQEDSGTRPLRVVYARSGRPTAALLDADASIVENNLFWVTCQDAQEAHYLLAVINSEVLYQAVIPLMPKGQYGARHVQKHLWKLPIPEFDPADGVHLAIADAGKAAADGVALQLASLREARGDDVSVTVVRRELRAWLGASAEGRAVEDLVGALLSLDGA